MQQILGFLFLLGWLTLPASAAVTTLAPNSYASVMLSNAGDTAASAGTLIGFSLAGDVIGPAEAGAIAIGAGFWYGDDDYAPRAFTLLNPSANAETAATTITFTWTASSDSSSITYRLIVDTDMTGAYLVDTTTASTSATFTLPANATYLWRVIASDLYANTKTEGDSSFLIDTAPPTKPVLAGPIGGSETTATAVKFRWSASTDSGSGVNGYRLQVSADSNFATLIVNVFHTGSTETTPLYLFSDTGIYYWRVAAVDDLGYADTSAPDSFRRPSPVDDTPPVAVGNLRAEANSDGTITLTWLKSPSDDMASGGQYNIYWDNGTGFVRETTALAVVAHTSDTFYSFTTGALIPDSVYSFIVRAQDRSGNENADTTKVLAKVFSGAPPTPHAVIIQPKSGNRILREMALIVAEIDPDTALNDVASVSFQFRADTTNANAPWTPMQTLTSQHPNPATDSAGRRFKIQWDIQASRAGNTAVASGVYQIRAVVTTTTGKTDTGPEIITVQVVDNNPDRLDRTTDDGVRTEEMLHDGRENRIVLADDDVAVDVTFPENILASDTAMLIAITSDAGTDAPDGKQGAGKKCDLTLSNGQSNFAGDKVTVGLSYEDADGNGVVDGTMLKVQELELWHKSAGSWSKSDDISVDTAARRVTGKVSGFSTFLLVGVAIWPNLTAFRVAPNPFRPNDGDAANGREFDGTAGSGIYFLNLPERVRLEIFTLTGVRVADISTNSSTGAIQWDARNGANRKVESGFYIYVVTNLASGQRVSGKLGVIR